MGFSRRFDVRLGARLAVFAAAVLAFGWLASRGTLPVTTIVCGWLTLWAGVAVWSLARRTNVELARFVAALEQRDLAQTFTRAGRGSGFDELGQAFDAAILALRATLAESAGQDRFSAALIDGAPSALLAVDGEGRVERVNKAARRLFAGADGVRIDDYAPLGRAFVEALRSPAVGRRSTELLIDGLPQRATLAVTSVERGGRSHRIVSVQVIQHELDMAEVAVQADLVRVLTHEIMNSMTPVTSLAASAAALMARLDDGTNLDIGDARVAVATLAKRAEGLMNFVESYRAFAQAPVLRIASFEARVWADTLVRLFAASDWGAPVRLDLVLGAVETVITGDVDLLTQVVINLMKNAAEAATAHHDSPQVALSITLLSDGRTKITVCDNGAGISAKYQRDVFLPFFTTKRTGTGVGLSFARQIILLHGGIIGIAPSEHGACIEIVL